MSKFRKDIYAINVYIDKRNLFVASSNVYEVQLYSKENFFKNLKTLANKSDNDEYPMRVTVPFEKDDFGFVELFAYRLQYNEKHADDIVKYLKKEFLENGFEFCFEGRDSAYTIRRLDLGNNVLQEI